MADALATAIQGVAPYLLVMAGFCAGAGPIWQDGASVADRIGGGIGFAAVTVFLLLLMTAP